MSSLDKAILEFIKKASRRIKFYFVTNLSVVATKLLLCLSFSLLLLSLFITFPYVEEVAIFIVIIGIIVSIVWGVIKAPKEKAVALIVDSKGLNERVTTSLELIGHDDEISIAQKQDTLDVISNFNLKEKIKISIDRKELLMIFALIVMCVLTMFVPSQAKRNAENIREFHKYQKEMIEKIEKEEKKIDKANDLEDKEREEIKKILEDAKKELKESERKSEINKTLERLEKKLEDKKKDIKSEEGKKSLDEAKKNLLEDFNNKKEEEAKQDLNKLVNELMKKKESAALAEAIMSNNKSAIDKEISNLKKSLGDMSSAELSKVSDSLKKAAEKINSEDLAEALSEAANSVLDGKLDSEKLSEAIASTMKESNKSDSSKEGQQSEGEGNDGDSGDGQGEGSGNGEGQGQGQGQGGSGQGGTGWNTGSTEGKENNLDNTPGEEIFIPGRNEGNDGNLTGNKNQSGNSQQVETENGLNQSGSKINYDKVIGDYTNSALEGINNSNLPESLKNLIKDYFNGLN